MGIKTLWLRGFENSALSQILIGIIIILGGIVIYFAIKEIIKSMKRKNNQGERKEIIELKKRERKIMSKLGKDKKDVESKIKHLKKSVKKKKK